MLIDLMAAMSHKDWLSRRQRQKQGIERAHTLGKYRGKQADRERHQKVMYYRQIKKEEKSGTKPRLRTQDEVWGRDMHGRHTASLEERIPWVVSIVPNLAE